MPKSRRPAVCRWSTPLASILLPSIESVAVEDHKSECPREACPDSRIVGSGQQFAHQEVGGIPAFATQRAEGIDRGSRTHVIIKPRPKGTRRLLIGPFLISWSGRHAGMLART
jgi:hypothetical protein